MSSLWVVIPIAEARVCARVRVCAHVNACLSLAALPSASPGTFCLAKRGDCGSLVEGVGVIYFDSNSAHAIIKHEGPRGCTKTTLLLINTFHSSFLFTSEIPKTPGAMLDSIFLLKFK